MIVSIRRASCCCFIPTPICAILSAGFDLSPEENSVSKTSQSADQGLRRVSYPEFAAKLASRRAELGNPDLSRNAGTRRTPSKRALLKAIEDAGGKW